MRKFVIGIGVLLVLLVASALILPSLIPASVYKDKIEQQISTSLGREVRIKGDVKLTVFPSLSAKAQSVTIANADGFDELPFATMESLQANVKLMPLLKKQVEITKFTLINPKISLEKSKNGETNWTFNADKNSTPKPTTAFARDGRYTDLQISLGTFALKNGSIAYKDASTGKTINLDAANLKMTMPGMDKPVTLKGDLIFNGMPMEIDTRLETPKAFLNGQSAPLALNLKSDIINLSANGTFTPSSAITFNMDFDADIPSVAKLDTILGVNNPYGDLTEKAKFRAALTYDGTVLSAKNAAIALDSTILSTDFAGNFQTGANPTASGDLSVAVKNVRALQDALKMDIPQIVGLNTINFTTNLITDGQKTSGKNISLDIVGNALTAHYTGAASFENALSLDGEFSANSTSITALLTDLGMTEIANTNGLGNFKMTGRISGPVDALTVKQLDLETKGQHMNAHYTGDISLGTVTSIKGAFTANSPSLKTFAEASGLSLPYADALGALATKGNISGNVKALNLTGLDLALTEGLLNIKFTGSANTGKALQYDGHVETNISSIRQLAALGGTQLAASTAQGEVYGPFSLSGQASGSASEISFSDATLTIDDIKGTGKFGADLRASKPQLSGVLNLQGLDLRPYMAAQNPTGALQPWSEAPLNLTVLNLFDANFTLNTPNIFAGRMEMGQSRIDTNVKNGVLTTNIPDVTLYGGQGELDMTLDAKTNTPKVALDFTLNNVDGNGFLRAAAGFTKLTGNTGTTMSFRGSGRSQAEIMASLNGDGNFELAEGVVSGVDIGQFVGGIETAFQQRALPAGLGNQYTTPFEKISGLFSVKNGVVSIGDFGLNASNVSAEGAGTINLGQQTIDFSLRPRLKEGKGLAAFGIPIRFTGGFGSVKAGLDTDLLGNVIAARAKAELQKGISNKVGGEVGSLLGGLLGTQETTPTPETGQTGEKTEDALNGLLGGILGIQPSETDSNDTQEKDEKKEPEEDILDKALSDLFGGD